MKIWIKRLILAIGAIFRICLWFFTRPKTEGALVLIYSNKDKEELLLVKKFYGKDVWSIPGGNRDKGETIEQTAVREVREEVGVSIKELQKIGYYKECEYFRDHTTYVFETIAEKRSIKRDQVEVSDARWFNVNELPERRGKSIFKVLEENSLDTH